MRLFLERGYDATTMDDLARAADVSRRSLFDYFATKEEVVFAPQDDFVPSLVEEMRQRPRDEPWPVLVEHALARAISHALTPESLAIDLLVRRTAALQPRRQLQYMRLEQAIASALAERGRGAASKQKAALLAAVVIAGFRLATTHPRGPRIRGDVREQVARDFRELWRSLRDFGEAGLAAR